MRCLSHRWRPIDALTDQDKKNLVPFGKTEEEILYICVEVILTARSPLESLAGREQRRLLHSF
ncbi:hypothetical protein Ocin01_18424 [Orchesella cincta]|uniref:Uncharacterized protein n=1 Tax=Orchesella cincta TaxID=48709 RepID=A0A1D2M5L0_ORCCI|nr:hypothetical protein Ocin01_18424 [Orchesella cincta]